jgi:hypothetical protein
MSTLQQLEQAGLDVELELSFDKKLTGKDADNSKDKLKGLIDKHGLQSPEVMKQVGHFQRAEILKPGIYKEFKDINEKLVVGDDGGNGQSATSDVIVEPDQQNDADVESTEEEFTFTDAEEERIKDMLRKEETKLRERMAKKEKQLRTKAANVRQKKAQRLGLKAEEAAKIKSLKDTIAANNEQIKSLRATNAKHREEISQIRPSAAAKVKVEPAQVTQFKKKIVAFLKKNPKSKSQAIVEGIGIDRKVFNTVAADMRKNKEVKTDGRGPYLTYTLA